jgi:AcrR family transcriptional regulator
MTMGQSSVRARSENKKAERRRVILDAALDLWIKSTYHAVGMSEVAEASGVAKGTLYLYFQTKEHLFLALLDEQFEAWFENVNSALDRPGNWDAARVVRVFTASLESHGAFSGLQSLLENVLEKNIDLQTACAFRQRLLEQLVVTASRLEQRLPFLRPGEGFRLLIHLRALLTGLYQMAGTSPIGKQVIAENPQMRPFDLDFRKESAAAIQELVQGFQANAPR